MSDRPTLDAAIAAVAAMTEDQFCVAAEAVGLIHGRGICTADNCVRVAHSKGLCSKHYWRSWAHPDRTPEPDNIRSIIQ